ncbi:MAG: alpha-L-rhamnosidase N-terminal domain-containing protein, partial [Bacteroidetes bacterium]|nr:alpha-L-rhamnosidase N-terminal domain-containing protein [Bacteroidota bacterium]
MQTAGTGTLLGLLPTPSIAQTLPPVAPPEPAPLRLPPEKDRLDLSPAQWIWYPSERTLPNSVVLFRRALRVDSTVRSATGWIAAESRYLLTIDGARVQWGPAPADPRRMEVDPLDLAHLLSPGNHTFGVTVLHYGHGDGTQPIGKPGLLFALTITYADGTSQTLLSNASWSTLLCRSWKPGQYKRWYLRALQEEFDSRLYPYGWDLPGFSPTGDWLPAQVLDCTAALPPSCSTYADHLLDARADRSVSCLIPRSIPLLTEQPLPVEELVEAYSVVWRRPAEEYFEMLSPEAFVATPRPVDSPTPGTWITELDGKSAAALTFRFREENIGFP